MKGFAVTVLLDSYDEKTVRTEVKAALEDNYGLKNIEITDVEELPE